MVNYSFFALAASALLASTNALELTTANFDEKTKGKTVFLKCYAPWCGHCQAMADDWAKLEKDFEGHKVALVASVDCTADESDELCERINVEGFPTLVWGDANALEQYEGDRSYESMKAFADEYVTKAVCSIENIDVCSDEEKAAIKAIEAKSDAELKEVATKVADEIKAEMKSMDDYINKLQDEYEKRDNEHNEKLRSIKKEGNFKILNQILAKRKIPNPMTGAEDPMDDDDDLSGGEL